jgi:hypothetical protein
MRIVGDLTVLLVHKTADQKERINIKFIAVDGKTREFCDNDVTPANVAPGGYMVKARLWSDTS